MWEFRKGNTFGATAFSSFGAFWLSYAAYVKFVVPGLPTATEYKATGLFLLAWAIFTAYMFLASLRMSGADRDRLPDADRDLRAAVHRRAGIRTPPSRTPAASWAS